MVILTKNSKPKACAVVLRIMNITLCTQVMNTITKSFDPQSDINMNIYIKGNNKTTQEHKYH